MRYFPLIGTFVGATSAGVFLLMGLLFAPSIALLLSMATSIWITGAFHEDGLADVCDGFGGGWTKEQTLIIMKDSRLGTYGVIGIGLLLALKFAALLQINNRADAIVWIAMALITGHTISRSATVWLISVHTYIRDEESGKIQSLAGSITRPDLLIATLFGLFSIFLAFLLTMHMGFLLSIVPVVMTTWLLGRYFKHRLGGYTGDCLGATQQITEVVLYLSLSSIQP
ncbi:adenosylcobinamide-GDP ribazoletransferase [Chloroflexi bacterium TSY]|nr:adenosylcobinamide-GDP ribazoletransferase [Chloroflexi bacterium TSY]